MKSHAYRPLYVVIAFVVIILVARFFFVPDTFGTSEMGYRFGWHDKANEKFWEDDFTVKYSSKDYCNDCHPDKVELISATPHVNISCQNCHGPALKHPEEPAKLAIDRGRELCLRCHAKLFMPGSGREGIRGIENDKHNPDHVCVYCHNPHTLGFN